MKLPRWTIVFMLAASTLAMFAVAAGWWITWPERTARVYISLIAEGNFEQADNLVVAEPDELGHVLEYPIPVEGGASAWDQSRMDCCPRSVWDVVVGRQEFEVMAAEYHFAVQLNRIVEHYFIYMVGRGLGRNEFHLRWYEKADQ
jgi:hypothetical protein